MLPAVALLIIGAIIWVLGSGSFGRAQTQAWIDRVRSRPKIYEWLNRHHGKFRASAHYIEFGGLFLISYWCWDSWFGDGILAWHPWRAVIIGVIAAIGAYMDEIHQLRSGTRQFRRVDFLHSLCGISIAAWIMFYQAWFRFS
ncbi:VanZ family protein [bacterium]|nr:VanZ family protein [bacterium]